MESCYASQVVETWQVGALPPASHAIKGKEGRQDGGWFGLGSIRRNISRHLFDVIGAEIHAGADKSTTGTEWLTSFMLGTDPKSHSSSSWLCRSPHDGK
jgi:hypothetical protein